MISCQYFNDRDACLAYRELIVTYRQKFRIPLPNDSMCASCRRTRPGRERIDSEDLLVKMREAGW